MDQPNKTPQNDGFSVDEILRQWEQSSAPEPAPADPPKEPPVRQQEPETDPKPKKKDKKAKKNTSKGRGCLVTFLWLFIIGVVSIALAVLALFGISDYTGIGKDFIRGRETAGVQIIIEPGASLQEIAGQLADHDVLISKDLFLLYSKLTHKGDDVNYGAHDFTTKMSYGEIFSSLAKPAKAADVAVTIPAAKRVDDILHILEDAGVCAYGDLRTELISGSFDSELWNAIPDDELIYYAAEGYLFPDTYRFYENDDPHRVIQTMLDNLETKFPKAMREDAAARGYTTHQIMTMASIVESEANGFFDEMPKVAAVFYNRLTDWPEGTRYLQSDPSMEYPYGGGAFNTYQSEGLPPGPICNASEAAIKAAVYPDETVTAYYFVTDSNSEFYFNETLSAHEATIAELKSKGLWLAQ